jgi:hypothetical protein
MRIMYRPLIIIPILLVAAVTAGAQSTLSNFAYDFDLRQAGGRADRLGLDFRLDYDRARSDPNPQGHHYGWTAGIEGSQTFDEAVRDADYMSATVSLEGRYYESALTPLPARVQARYLDLFARDSAGGGPGLTPDEEKELNGLFERLRQSRRFMTYDLHYRFESDQDLDRGQHVVGAAVSAEVPLLHRLLDALPAETRGDSLYLPQPVRAYFGADYVGGIDDTTSAEGDEKAAGRLRVEAAWGTYGLGGMVVRIRWQGHLLLDPPQDLDARDREFNSFVEASVILPLSAKTGVLLKYIDGRLPPGYEAVSVGAMGLSISLQ